MRETEFRELETRLLRSGVAPRHVRRMQAELLDHYCDLVDEAAERGASPEDARVDAASRLGKLDEIVAAALARKELRSWAYRYPGIAIVAYPLACLLMLPAVPVVASIAKAPLLARWGASLLLAGFFTAAMMLVLQLSISFG